MWNVDDGTPEDLINQYNAIATANWELYWHLFGNTFASFAIEIMAYEALES